MEEIKQYRGLRIGDTWIVETNLTFDEADELIQRRMHGGNREENYWLEEEGDHLVASLYDRNEPVSGGYPGNNGFPKDQVWGSMRGTGAHSGKRKEYPNF
jgi:hypothetical protein